jgi:DNA-binding NtrC family response regulator
VGCSLPAKAIRLLSLELSLDTLVDITSAEIDRLLSDLQDRMKIQSDVALAGVWRAVIRIRCARGNSIKLREIERELIETVLELNNGSRTQSAKQLGISLRGLHYRLREYREKPREERP